MSHRIVGVGSVCYYILGRQSRRLREVENFQENSTTIEMLHKLINQSRPRDHRVPALLDRLRGHPGVLEAFQIPDDEFLVRAEKQIVTGEHLAVPGPTNKQLFQRRRGLGPLPEMAQNAGERRKRPSGRVRMSACLASKELSAWKLVQRHMRECAGLVKRPEVSVAGTQLGGHLEQRNCLFSAPTPDKSERKRKISLREARVQRDRILEFRNRVVILPVKAVGAAEYASAQRVALVESDRDSRRSHRSTEQLRPIPWISVERLLEQHIAKPSVSSWETGLKLNRAPKHCLGLVETGCGESPQLPKAPLVTVPSVEASGRFARRQLLLHACKLGLDYGGDLPRHRLLHVENLHQDELVDFGPKLTCIAS